MRAVVPPCLSSTFSPGLRPATHFFPPARAQRHLSSRAVLPSIQAPSPRLRACLRSVLAARCPPAAPGPPASFFTPSLCRHASTAAGAHASRPTPAGVVPPSPAAGVLDWNSFFRLRASRRRYSLASSVVTSAGTTVACIYALSNYPDFGDWLKIIPTDPFISMGLVTFASAFLGWLVGPVFGTAVWRVLHRARLPEFTIKERAFFDRIKRYRVNPSGASSNNPVPDFYGEKVGSVAGYRRWLKDQKAFNRKKGQAFIA